MINHKPTAVRIIPVYGKDVGDEAVRRLGYTPIIEVHEFCKDFIIEGDLSPVQFKIKRAFYALYKKLYFLLYPNRASNLYS